MPVFALYENLLFYKCFQISVESRGEKILSYSATKLSSLDEIFLKCPILKFLMWKLIQSKYIGRCNNIRLIAFCNRKIIKCKMFNYRTSIRQKIIVTYYIGIMMIVNLSFLAFFTLRFMDKKIMFWEVTSTIFNTTLEIRRFEKNYFLYGDDSDFSENISYVKRARDILDSDVENYKSLEVYPQLVAMKSVLKKYEEMMEEFHASRKQNSIKTRPLVAMINENGKAIVAIAENVSKSEWRKLQLFLKETTRNLVISIAILSFAGIVIGQILSKMVVKPLKSLENRMKLIAEGELEEVAIDSKDREIVSLTNAFNKMLTELELRRKYLVQKEKLASLGTLLSGVAHELNNPLSNISSSCQILTEEIEEADMQYKKELLSQIDDQANRARNIIRSLLDFSREKISTNELFPLRKIIEETILLVKGEIPTKVDIVLDIPENIIILAEKQRIQQAFLNLIKNAIQSIADEGHISIKARKHSVNRAQEEEEKPCGYPKYRGKCTGKCPSHENTVDIEITDTGQGIPPELLTKIFDPFFTTKDVGHGSGLGLFIVQEIIEKHDGCIGVDSEVGKGTTFLIRLPLKE